MTDHSTADDGSGEGPDSGEAILEGLLVVDFSEGIAGPYCTKLLAGFGARVVKVELPRGDVSRQRGPYPDDQPNPEASGLFLHLNAGKEGIVVDYERPEGARVVRDLIAGADVVIESAVPGRLVDLGLAADDLLGLRPSLVVCSVTPFGQTGPRRHDPATSITLFALGGPMSASGRADSEPLKLAGNVIEYQAGNTAFTAVLGALYYAGATGVGQHVDISNLETQAGSTDRIRAYHLAHQYSGTVVLRDSAVGRRVGGAGGRFVAADGVTVTPGAGVWPTHIERMVATLDEPRITDLLAEEGPAAVSAAGDLVNPVIAAWVAQRSGRQAMREAQANGWPIVVVNNPLSILTDEHLAARGFWREIDHPIAGRLPYAGPPWRIDEGGWGPATAAPTLGCHTDAVLAQVAGYDEDEIRSLRSSGIVA